MEERNRIDAATALDEVRRIDRHVRSSGRWHGWLWLIMAVITPVFLVGANSGTGDVRLVIALGFVAAGLGLWFWESRQLVVGREAARLDMPLTWAYAGLVVLVSILLMTVLPDRFTIWLLIVGVLPAVPCLIGAWRVFRQ